MEQYWKEESTYEQNKRTNQNSQRPERSKERNQKRSRRKIRIRNTEQTLSSEVHRER